MKQECVASLNSAAGRKLEQGELDAVEERLHSAIRELSLRDNAAFMAMSPRERAVEGAKLAKEWMLRDVVRAHEQTIQEASRKAALFANTAAVQPGLKGQVHWLKNRLADVERSVTSITANILRQLEGLTQADGGKLFGLLQNPEKQRDIVRGLFGESTTPEAQKAADSIKKVMNIAADRFQMAGLTLNKREDYRTPQPQDPIKASTAGRDAWVEDHMNWVDRRAYVTADGHPMDDDQLRHMLQESWRSIALDGANKRAENEPVRGTTLIGNSKNAPRQLFFKDSEAWSQAMKKYGRTSNLYELIGAHVRAMSKDIAMAESFGRNAEQNFTQALAKAKEADHAALGKEDEFNKLTSLEEYTKSMFRAYLNPERPQNAVWANRMNNLRGLISSTQLGNIASVIPDLAGLKTTAELNGLPQMRLFSEVVNNTLAGREKLDFSRSLGVWFEGFQSAQHRMAEDNLSHGWGNFLNEVTHRAAGMNAFDRGTRAGLGRVVLDTVGKFTREHDTLASAEGETRLLRDKGVTEDHWQVWKAADLERGPSGDGTLLSPQAIYDTPDAKLDPIVEQRVAERSATLKAEIDRRDEQNQREQGWLAGAWSKLEAARDKAYKWLREFDERGVARLERAQTGADAKGGLLFALSEKAQLQADISKAAAEARNMGQVSNFFGDIKRGVEWYGRRRSEIGEKLGYRTRMLEESIRDLESRSRAATKDNEAAQSSTKARVGGMISEVEAALAGINQRIEARLAKIERGQSLDSTVERLQGEVQRGNARAEEKAVDVQALKQKLDAELAELKAKDSTLQSGYKERIETLNKKLELAQTRADIDSYLATEKNRDALESFAQNLQWRNKQMAGRTFDIGEQLGRRQAELDARIKELQARVDAQQAEHERRVGDKAAVIDKRFQGLVKDLQARAEEYANRAAKRQEFADAFQAKLGNVLDEERMRLRNEAAEKLLDVAHRTIQVGARGASSSTMEDRMALGLHQTKAGTLAGELHRFAVQFKSVPLGVFRAHWEASKDLGSWGSVWAYRAKFVAYSMLMGALATEIKAMINGQNPRDMNFDTPEGRKFWIEALAAGGGLGIYGDLFANGQTAMGAGAETLMGPGISAGWDLVKTARQAVDDAEKGDSKNPYLLNAVRFVRRNTMPLMNLWYIKAAFNRLVFDNLQEKLSPGAADKQRQRMEMRGASYWWAPGTNSPQHAPDLAQAWK